MHQRLQSVSSLVTATVFTTFSLDAISPARHAYAQTPPSTTAVVQPSSTDATSTVGELLNSGASLSASDLQPIVPPSPLVSSSPLPSGASKADAPKPEGNSGSQVASNSPQASTVANNHAGDAAPAQVHATGQREQAAQVPSSQATVTPSGAPVLSNSGESSMGHGAAPGTTPASGGPVPAGDIPMAPQTIHISALSDQLNLLMNKQDPEPDKLLFSELAEAQALARQQELEQARQLVEQLPLGPGEQALALADLTDLAQSAATDSGANADPVAQDPLKDPAMAAGVPLNAPAPDSITTGAAIPSVSVRSLPAVNWPRVPMFSNGQRGFGYVCPPLATLPQAVPAAATQTPAPAGGGLSGKLAGVRGTRQPQNPLWDYLARPSLAKLAQKSALKSSALAVTPPTDVVEEGEAAHLAQLGYLPQMGSRLTTKLAKAVLLEVSLTLVTPSEKAASADSAKASPVPTDSSAKANSGTVKPIQVSQGATPTMSASALANCTTVANRNFQYSVFPYPDSSVGMAWPLPIPATVTSRFGWRVHPITGQTRFHSGTDLAAPWGTPVLSVLSGQVVVADYLNGYGYTVVVEHPDIGARTLYAHLSAIAVTPGTWVDQGSVVGQVGSTGLSTGPHLHFEVRRPSTEGWLAVDPGP